MSGDFERFSHRLDEEWRREQLRRLAPRLVTPSEQATLLEELERADPLAPVVQRRWLVAVREAFWVREAFRTWPGRMAFAAAACALLVIGFVVGLATTGPSTSRVALKETPATPIEMPEYKPDAGGRALGIGAPARPESERKFREAMAFYNTPEFPSRALPLLREAVALDGSNDRAQFWLGVTLLLYGKSAPAIPPLEEATRLAPASTVYKQYLLFAHLRSGDVAKALRVQTELMKRP